jgi:thiamine kinase-like enzyme
MDATLPTAVSLNLQQALESWQAWLDRPARQPMPERILSGGRSNNSFLVGDGERYWVVRVDGVDPHRLGLDREAEWDVLQSAARVGLAPRPAYRETSVLVCAYREPAAEVADSLATVAELLRKIHALPAVDFRMNPRHRALGYAEIIGLEALPSVLLESLQWLEESPTPPRLCHNDLLSANRLQGSAGLLALDWEYAATGDPMFDLAVIVEGDGLIEEEAQALLDAWLERPADQSERARLEHQRVVYRELAALWEQAMDTLRVEGDRID